MNTPKKQEGTVMILITIALAVIIGMAGMAIDVGHMTLRQGEVQNAVDAASLSGARTLSGGGDTYQAETDAVGTLNRNIDNLLDNANVTVEFSPTLVPWEGNPAGLINQRYVRVLVDSVGVLATLTRVFGAPDQFNVAASAVAGPIPLDNEVCDLMPIIMCSSDAENASPGELFNLHEPTGGGANWKIGPGNFGWVSYDGNVGAHDLKEYLATGEGCTAIGETESQPGNIASAEQGFNERWGINHPAVKVPYLPDTDLREDITYDEYVADGQGNGRRTFAVPTTECPSGNGRHDITVDGFACFFSREPMYKNRGNLIITGEFIGDCMANGNVAETPEENANIPHEIILYNDPNAPRS